MLDSKKLKSPFGVLPDGSMVTPKDEKEKLVAKFDFPQGLTIEGRLVWSEQEGGYCSPMIEIGGVDLTETIEAFLKFDEAAREEMEKSGWTDYAAGDFRVTLTRVSRD